jgi:hypothetical protein
MSDVVWRRKAKYGWISKFPGAVNSIFRWESRYPGYERIWVFEEDWASGVPQASRCADDWINADALVQYKGWNVRGSPDGGVELIEEPRTIHNTGQSAEPVNCDGDKLLGTWTSATRSRALRLEFCDSHAFHQSFRKNATKVL